jgi:RNA polymerase sigma-70 factor (ECF subfamily)
MMVQSSEQALRSEEHAVEFAEFDANYVDRLRSGDRSTQDHFVSYFSDLIRLKLRSRLKSYEAIEDVRQETFARVLLVLRREDGLRHADRLGAFVNTVCNHVLQEQYRSHRKSVTALEEESEAMYVDDKPSPLSQLETKDAARLVQQSLADMPERDRLLLRSVLMEERDKDDVCAELGVSREYLRVLVHRAKQSFKAFYISKLS